MNNLLQVKFIKFFAWEDRWIQRVLDAREAEMQWMIKCRSFSPIHKTSAETRTYVDRSRQLRLLLVYLVVCTSPHLSHIVPCVCHARQPVDPWDGLHCECGIYPKS